MFIQEDSFTVSDNVGSSYLGWSSSLSSNGNTLASGGIGDDSQEGAVWVC